MTFEVSLKELVLLHNSRLVASVTMNLESGTSSWAGVKRE